MIEGRLSVEAPPDVRLRRIIGPDHALWDAALVAIERWPPSMKRRGDQTWPHWFRYLAHLGIEPLEATADHTDAFLAGFPAGARRTRHRGTLRCLYRAALDLGLIDQVPILDLVIGYDHRGKHRLSDGEVVKLVASLTKDLQNPMLALRAGRDLVLVSLACSFERDTESWRILAWRDVDLDSSPATIRITERGRIDLVVLPDVVVRSIIAFRTSLARRGVDVVPEDALLPALGRRIEWDWTLPGRALLAPLESPSIHNAFSVMRRRASIGRHLEAGAYFNHRWLLRDVNHLDAVLRADQSADRAKVAMRRPVLTYDPASVEVAA